MVANMPSRAVNNAGAMAPASRLAVVGLGGAGGALPALSTFFRELPEAPGVAFVVLVTAGGEHDGRLPQVLRDSTRLSVIEVDSAMRLKPDTIYVVPPGAALQMMDDHLRPAPPSAERAGRYAVDLFLRTLAETHGPRAVSVVLSGADSDGAIGLKRIKERGGLTIAQDPEDAQDPRMPAAAIGTGMVDWVLPAAEMARRVVDYIRMESRVSLPGEQPAAAERASSDEQLEADLREVLGCLRARTGRDFANYKRATILRRIGRRMQVNGVSELSDYLRRLRTRPGESGALLQDLLISVTNFFRDPDCFAALEARIPALFAGKPPAASVRVWVPGCATGEEAYSIAMLLAEHARTLDAPPSVQIFATDLDAEAIRVARDAVYPSTIEADVSEDRLKRFFAKEHRGYRVRRELREQVMFAEHDLLKDSPFSRLDMISCRNLLIYLNREAQQRVFETAHFALQPQGLLFLGASETVEDGGPLFHVLDKKHRLYASRPVPRSSLPVPIGQSALARALETQETLRPLPVVADPRSRSRPPPCVPR